LNTQDILNYIYKVVTSYGDVGFNQILYSVFTTTLFSFLCI